MKTITTRKLDKETYDRTERFLQQAGHHAKDNMFFYQLEVQSGTDGGLVLDALVDLYDNKIAIKAIWVFEHNPIKGMLSARNDGERGSYAKILGEKYFNRFFEHLTTVDIDNVQERQGFLFVGGKFVTIIGTKEDFDRLTPIMVDSKNVKDGRYAITPDLIKKVEDEIDRHIDPEHITEAVINAYDRIELILSVEHSLRHLCKELGENDFRVTFDKDAQVFNVALLSNELDFIVTLGDIVRKKWETGETLACAAISCGLHSYEIADWKKKNIAIIVKGMLNQVMPILRKNAGQDQKMLESLVNNHTVICENQASLYCEGREQYETGQEKWSREEFIDLFGEELEQGKYIPHYIDRLYGAYSSGFDKLAVIPV